MSDPLLGITDGTTTVNLINRNSGIFLHDWTPSIAPLKGGGTYQQSVMSEGKQLVMTNYDNAIETFALKIREGNQDSTIRESQELLRLLEKARSYWTTSFQTEPVWLFARAPNETNTRYAIIHNYKQSGLDNPYAQPFFSCGDATMDDITLVVERGHWAAQIPGQPDCAKIAASSADSIARLTESVTAGTDDAFVNHTGGGISLTANNLQVGNHYDTQWHYFDSGFRFSSVDVGDDKTIEAVYLRLTNMAESMDVGAFSQGDVLYKAFGEDVDAAATFSTYANFAGRTLTSEFVDFYPDDYAQGDVILLNVTDIFNEIRDRAGWSDGDPMAFFLNWSYSAPGIRLVTFIASIENTSFDEPQLIIDYGGTKGETTPSCENKNYITDKYNQAALSHIYTDDGGAFSANLVDSTAIDIYPAVPAVNDAIYFGSTIGPFTNVVMYIDVVQEDLTIAWEYYQGGATAAWSALPAANQKDKTDDFLEVGYGSLTFSQPRDTVNGAWVTRDLSVDGGPAITAYWIRARVTAVGGGPVRPETSTIACYTVTWPSISLADGEVLGDISALATGVFGDEGIRATGKLRRDRLIVALQSERGPYAGQNYNFNAYLPYSDEQLPSVIDSINGVSGDFSYASDISAPSGRSILLNPAGTGTQSVYITVDSSNFFGKYRVFTRIRQINGSDNHFFFQVTTKHGSTVYASTNEVPCLEQSDATDANWQLLDLGEISIPTGIPARMAEENVKLDIYMNIRVVNITGSIYLCDLILMPADEWIADLQDFGDGNWSGSKSIYIDSSYVPKADVRGLVRRQSGSYVNPIPYKTIGGKFTVPANKGSNLWIVSAYLNSSGNWISEPGIISKVKIYKSERYLGLRGNR